MSYHISQFRLLRSPIPCTKLDLPWAGRRTRGEPWRTQFSSLRRTPVTCGEMRVTALSFITSLPSISSAPSIMSPFGRLWELWELVKGCRIEENRPRQRYNDDISDPVIWRGIKIYSGRKTSRKFGADKVEMN